MLSGGILTFHAFGVPVPQGSLSTYGKTTIVAVPKPLKVWRQTVADAAKEAMGDAPPSDMPCVINAIFYLPKPKRPRFPDVPATKPDGDKLLRAVQDAVTGIVVANDSRFVQGTYVKKWAAPDHPGVVVMVDWNGGYAGA